MQRNTARQESFQPLQKPSIIEVIGQRVELRKAGRQYQGRCPFHSEKTASFTVSADKGVFYCHGCHVGGDVIRFVQLLEETDFKGALKLLGIDGGQYKPKSRDLLKQRGAAMVATWMNEQHAKAGAMLRQLTQSLVTAEEAGASTLIELWQSEFDRLELLFDGLQYPEFAAGFWAARDGIEAITARAPAEPLPEFPPWTPEYAAYLAAHLPASEAVT